MRSATSTFFPNSQHRGINFSVVIPHIIMSSIEALLQWVDTHPVLSLIALAVIFLSNVVLSICLFLSFRTCTMSIQQCFMYWVERRYPQDKLRQESHPKGWDLESISKILAGLDEIVTLLIPIRDFCHPGTFQFQLISFT